MAAPIPTRKLFGDGVDECPECAHLWTEGSEGHYADCRYRLYEEGLTAEENEKMSEHNLQWRSRSIFNSAA